MQFVTDAAPCVGQSSSSKVLEIFLKTKMRSMVGWMGQKEGSMGEPDSSWSPSAPMPPSQSMSTTPSLMVVVSQSKSSTSSYQANMVSQ